MKPVPSTAPAPFAAVILAGGQSRRMGRPKALLPFDEVTLLGSVVERLRRVTGNVIVVGSAGAAPVLTVGVTVVHDERPDGGPLEGLRVGLRAAAEHAATAFVTGCDYPFVSSQLARALVDELSDDVDAVVPRIDGVWQPLLAAYRVAVAARIDARGPDAPRSPTDLLRLIRVGAVDADFVKRLDPTLDSLINVNDPDDYDRALAILRQRSSGMSR
jgi:molybdopterin-guanine dinucleotide biosynthesis protein A